MTSCRVKLLSTFTKFKPFTYLSLPVAKLSYFTSTIISTRAALSPDLISPSLLSFDFLYGFPHQSSLEIALGVMLGSISEAKLEAIKCLPLIALANEMVTTSVKVRLFTSFDAYLSFQSLIASVLQLIDR